MQRPNSVLLYAAIFVGVVAFSTSAIFVKLSSAPAPILAFYRLLFSTILMLPWVMLFKSNRQELRTLHRHNVYKMLLSGLLLAIHFVLWFESLHYTSVASSTVLVSLQPLFTVIGSYLFFQERLPRMAYFGGVLAIFGSFIIGIGDFRIGGQALWGDLLALGGAAMIAVYLLIGKSIRQQVSLPTYSFVVYFSSSAFLAIYCASLGLSFGGYSRQDWLLFAALALIPTLLGQTIMNGVIRWVSPSTISMSVLGEPVGTCILAYFLLQERLTLEQWIGSLVILCGILIYSLYSRTAGTKANIAESASAHSS